MIDQYALYFEMLFFYSVTRFSQSKQYVDPNYQGGGLGEYQYYNKQTGTYDCYNGGYCRAQMDCHSSTTTTWQLVGIFKIDRLSQGDGWMEQLFKHAGVCYWGWDNYEIAANMRESLPNECQKTGYKFNGMYLYSDVKPSQNAGISMGLYTDESCSQLYDNTNYNPFVDTDMTESDFNTFNNLLDDYKICQPCIAYDLTQYDFSCADDAGYTNCNQVFILLLCPDVNGTQKKAFSHDKSFPSYCFLPYLAVHEIRHQSRSVHCYTKRNPIGVHSAESVAFGGFVE